jgi:DNA-binding LacI/PurR family transcriptional regulator
MKWNRRFFEVEPVDLGEAEEVLLESGLLYALNKLVLHPCGLALALSYEDDEPGTKPTAMELVRTKDNEPIVFSGDVGKMGRDRLRGYLARLRENGVQPSNIDLLESLCKEDS